MKTLLALFLLFATPCFATDIKVRVLALKHSKENMAQDDENLAFQSIQSAQGKGFGVKAIGGHWVNKDGVMRVVHVEFENIDKFREFVSEQMKIDAESGDTVIVFTIGHGFREGKLDNLGPRADVQKAIAQAAVENNQRTLWWQLSCYGLAGMPSLSMLPKEQQELLSIVASSDSQTPSPAGVEGRLMGKIFDALAGGSKEIDPNGDDQVTADELKVFLRTSGTRRDNQFLFSSGGQLIFGGKGLANQIPIVDRNNPQGRYPGNYVPTPQR